MQFTIPTTKEEMYVTLREIYAYYRLRLRDYEPEPIGTMSLYRATFTPLTDAELTEKAETLTLSKNEERKAKKREALNAQILKANSKLSTLSQEESAAEDKINDAFDESEEKLRADAVKKGYSNSSILVNAIASLETERNTALAKNTSEYSAKRSEYNAIITSATAELNALSSYFSDVHTAEKNAEFLNLKDAQNKRIEEVEKYNAIQDEKEQRLDVSVSLSNADRVLRFLALRETSYSKEELVEMGYYSDVIDCITGYYDTLATDSARYADFVSERKLVYYLEDYYPDILYMYKTAAGY